MTFNRSSVTRTCAPWPGPLTCACTMMRRAMPTPSSRASPAGPCHVTVPGRRSVSLCFVRGWTRRTLHSVVLELQNLSSPFTELLGLRIDQVGPDEVTARLTVAPERHLHPWGAVHGGVYCALVETLATLGAQALALQAGKLASGIENHTTFLRQG